MSRCEFDPSLRDVLGVGCRQSTAFRVLRHALGEGTPDELKALVCAEDVTADQRSKDCPAYNDLLVWGSDSRFATSREDFFHRKG